MHKITDYAKTLSFSNTHIHTETLRQIHAKTKSIEDTEPIPVFFFIFVPFLHFIFSLLCIVKAKLRTKYRKMKKKKKTNEEYENCTKFSCFIALSKHFYSLLNIIFVEQFILIHRNFFFLFPCRSLEIVV